MDDEQIKEAAWVAQIITGLSVYLYGIGYSLEQRQQELEKIGEHAARSAQE